MSSQASLNIFVTFWNMGNWVQRTSYLWHTKLNVTEIWNKVSYRAYLKSRGTGETMTLTLSSPLVPGGPNATTGSLMFLRRPLVLALLFKGGGSRDLSNSFFSAALYNSLWSPTHLAGYMNSALVSQLKKKNSNKKNCPIDKSHGIMNAQQYIFFFSWWMNWSEWVNNFVFNTVDNEIFKAKLNVFFGD